MPRQPDAPDPYSQRASLLVDPLTLDGSTWTRSGITATPQGTGGLFLLSNASVNSEIYQGITSDRAGPIVASWSLQAGTLSHARPYLYNATTGLVLASADAPQILSAVNYRRIWVRGYVAAASQVIRTYLRLGRGGYSDTGNIYAFEPTLEWGEMPSQQRIASSNASAAESSDPMFYIRAENNSQQTHVRRRGDLARILVIALQTRDGAAVDLTGCTVAIRLLKEGDDTVEVAARSGDISSPATDGICTFTFQAGDVDTAGLYNAQIIRTVTSGGATEAFPPDKSFKIRILPAP